MIRRTQGFTLLELLVVLVILGITLSFAVLSFGLKNPQDELKQQGQRLAALMQLASEESILLGQELAMQFADDGYEFLTLKKGQWAVIENDQIFRHRYLPQQVRIDLSVEGSDVVDNENTLARIYFFSSGEATPFTVTLRSQDTDYRYYVSGDSQAAIEQGDAQSF